MATVGHRTESIYRRYAIVDEVMLHRGRYEGGGLLGGGLEADLLVASLESLNRDDGFPLDEELL
jgi:hypothetical protein